ncbi:hypothetical protein CMI37_10670 [Candidatus Pacearchaeota archaeon]|nr:hypothetical protein [Candidatus Pacearchaeota archaeon]
MKNFFEPDDEHDFHDMENVPQYTIERYAYQVEEILSIFEMQEFFVSDNTQIKDFKFTPSEFDNYNHKLKESHGIEITRNDYIWEIAEKIYENQF